jgi:DNA gyrase/topoisomerase IV subunit B
MSSMDIFHLQKEYVTTLIHDTIETYPGPWRLVHEGSQNAADAIQQNSKIKAGKIEIELRVASNRVTISDDGCGVPIKKFASIFQLGGGEKRDGELRKLLKGSQGVGIKATCYTSTYFAVRTVHDGQKWSYEAKGLDKFSEPSFRSDIIPPVTAPTREASGTTIEYALANYSVLDFLNDLVAEYLEDSQFEELADVNQLKVAIEQYFRTKTYLGCVLRLLGTNLNSSQ